MSARMTIANMQIVQVTIRRMTLAMNGKTRMTNRLEILVVIGSLQEHAHIGNGKTCPTLTEAMGMGGGQIPMVVTKRKENE